MFTICASKARWYVITRMGPERALSTHACVVLLCVGRMNCAGRQRVYARSALAMLRLP